MKTVVLKTTPNQITLGNPLMTKSGYNKATDVITLLVNNVPDEVNPLDVIKIYQQVIIVPQSVFEFDFEKINVKPGTMVWLDEAKRPNHDRNQD